MSNNCCKLKYTSISNSLKYNDEDIVLKVPLQSLAPFDPQYSGLWKPCFYNSKISQNNPTFWFNPSTPFVEKGVINPVPSGKYKDYIGIQDFITINNIQLKDWNITNGQYIIDLVPSLSDNIDVVQQGLESMGMSPAMASGTEKSALLFWYRYYDIGRAQDSRILPGLELYISDADCYKVNISGIDHFFLDKKIYNQQYGQSSIATPDSQKLKYALSGIGIPDAENKGKILSTGPQLDWITETLSSGIIKDWDPQSPNNDPTVAIRNNGIILPPTQGRNEYGLDSEKLRQMSMRTYRNVGLHNFILSKKDLVNRLRQKYGGALTVGQSQTVVLESKFKTLTGPNINIRTSGAIQIKQAALNYCNVKYIVGGLIFQTEFLKTDSQYNLTYADGLDIFWSGYPQKTINDPTPVKKQDSIAIFKGSINSIPIAHYYVADQSGLMDPSITSISYHGLGGINIKGRSELQGTYFTPNFNTDELEKSPTTIRLEYTASSASRYKISDWIFIDYLRTQSKPTCRPFLEDSNNQICKCSQFKALDPTSTRYDLSQHFYVPDISLYYLPSGIFYGGLSGTEVDKYPKISGHPSPGTPFPRDRKIVKDFPGLGLSGINLNCDYYANGDHSGVYNFRIPTIGKIFLNYIGTNSRFGILWDGLEKFSTSGENIFASYNGTICLEKNKIEPQTVGISINNSGSGLWGISVDFQPHNYLKDQFIDRVLLSGTKGFFHPNSGWVSGTIYNDSSVLYHRSPLMPYKYNNTGIFNTKHARINYNAQYMYKQEYLSGYNYLIETSGLNFKERNIFDSGTYLALKINNTNSYFVTPNYTIFNYTREDSPILEQIPFYYGNLYSSTLPETKNQYPLGDFKYIMQGSNPSEFIKVSSIKLGNNRISKIFDIPLLNTEKETILIPDLNSIDIPFKITQVSGDPSGDICLTINPPLNTGTVSPRGFFNKLSKSLLLYHPSQTYNDNINIGKWGNILIYNLLGEYIPNTDEYNHSIIRTSGENNPSTFLSWSSPFRITDVDSNNPVYWNPKAYVNINNITYQPSGYKLTTFSTSSKIPDHSVVASGNHVVSHTSPQFKHQLSMPIYLGSNIGAHKVVVNVSKWNKNGNIQLLYNNVVVDTQTIDGSGNKPIVSGVYPIWENNKNQIELSFNKTTNLPVFGEIVINNNVKDCYSNKRPSFIENAIVYLDTKPLDIIKENRIRYYGHHDTNLDSKWSSSRDLIPYLDMHLFGTDVSQKLQNLPESGIVSFENALTLKNSTYFNRMNTKYDGSKYWVDVSAKNSWGILTSKNILLLPHITYTATKSLRYSCDTNVSKCSSRYSNDVCSNSYELSLNDLFNTLGLEGVDQNLFDIITRTYPAECSSISDCCLVSDSGCKTAESGTIQKCLSSYSGVIKCLDYACPSNGLYISGIYNLSKEVYEFKIKNTIDSSYFKDQVQLALMNNMSGHNISFENYNNTHIVNLDNTNLLVKNDMSTYDTHIINTRVVDYDTKLCTITSGSISNDLFKYIYSQTGIAPLSTGQYFYNEIVYRRNVPHPNQIHEPLFEYDPKADHDDTEIIYAFKFGLKECTSSDQNIMTMTLNNNIELKVDFIVSSGYPAFNISVNNKSKILKLPQDINLNIGEIRLLAETWPNNTSGCSRSFNYFGVSIGYTPINNGYKAYYTDTRAYASNIAMMLKTNNYNSTYSSSAWLPKSGPVDCDILSQAIKQIMNTIDPSKTLNVVSCGSTDRGEIIGTQNCNSPCSASLITSDISPPSKKQLDDYASSCPDATYSKQSNFGYYDLINQGGSWSLVKRTGNTQYKDNLDTFYDKKTWQEIKGNRQELNITYKIDGCLRNDTLPNDIRKCCSGHDISIPGYPGFTVMIKKYKNLFFITISNNINSLTYNWDSTNSVSFCEPISLANYFECPKIVLSLGSNIYFSDQLSSKVYNCTRGLLS